MNQHSEPGEGSVHEEYRRLAASWPYELPSGYRFPSSPLFEDLPRGFAYALCEVYTDWRCATATAAFAAHLRGNGRLASRLLRRIKATYGDDIRRRTIFDPENGYLRDAIEPALHGDFTVLKFQDIDPFLHDAERAAITRMAGDL